jgi:hypothetical protein
MSAHFFQLISFLAYQDHCYGAVDRRERAEISKEQPEASRLERKIRVNIALFLV